MSTHLSVARGWNRPVSPGALILVSVLLVVVWLASISLGTWFFYETVEARFTLRDQPVALRLPVGMKAMAEIPSPVRTHLDFHPSLLLRIDQPMRVQITDSLVAHTTLNTTLPIDTSVEVDTVVPVRTSLDLQVSLKSWLPRVPVSVPLTLNLPVRMTVPIRADVPVSLDLDVAGELPSSLVVPVRGDFRLRPHVRGDIDVRMNALTLFRMIGPIEPFDVRIDHTEVRMPFNLGLRHPSLP